jgi:hypothetical protein
MLLGDLERTKKELPLCNLSFLSRDGVQAGSLRKKYKHM